VICIEKITQNLLVMKKVLFLKYRVLVIIITLTAFNPLQSCKEECGCASEPYKAVSNAEAKYFYFGSLNSLENPGTTYTICNIDILSEEIQLRAEDAWRDELGSINVVVSGELHKGCNVKMSFYRDPGITLTDIKLQ
jgi:hypothetical protein